MKDRLDELLKHALTPTDEPDFWLNQKILNQAKEREGMDRKKMRRIPAAALTAAIVLGCGSVSAYAAWRYLTPQNVAERTGESKIADAFKNGDAIYINETQSFGGYDVTLLGVVSGKELSVYPVFDENGSQLEMDKTYSVLAITNADKTPMPESSDDAYMDLAFFVSPLIRDYNPWKYNAVTMNGGYCEFVEDGVLYRMAECDNVEIFADHGLYLCVNDGSFYNQEAYHYDEASGEISRNEDYDGLNALFDLPIDASKADPEAAEQYFSDFELDDEEEDAEQSEDTEQPEEESAFEKWISQITADNIDEYADLVESSVQTCMPDESGYISYKWNIDGRGAMEGSILTSDYFTKGEKFAVNGLSCFGEEEDKLLVETLTLNDDGAVTYAVYIPKENFLSKV